MSANLPLVAIFVWSLVESLRFGRGEEEQQHRTTNSTHPHRTKSDHNHRQDQPRRKKNKQQTEAGEEVGLWDDFNGNGGLVTSHCDGDAQRKLRQVKD